MRYLHRIGRWAFVRQLNIFLVFSKCLFVAFIIKASLTVITFGIKVPAGIYVPSMVVGGLVGRFIGHSVQLLALRFMSSWIVWQLHS